MYCIIHKTFQDPCLLCSSFPIGNDKLSKITFDKATDLRRNEQWKKEAKTSNKEKEIVFEGGLQKGKRGYWINKKTRASH